MQEFIIQLLTTYQLPAIFFGAFFFGEAVIINAAFLAGQGIWSLWYVFILSYLGTLVADTLWFLLGKTLFKLSSKIQISEHRYKPFLNYLESFIGHRTFLLLLIIKFLYGTRVLTIIYLSVRRVSFWPFMLYNSISTFLWLVIMVGIGWLAGKSIGNYISLVDNLGYLMVVILMVFLLIKVLNLWIRKKIFKK